MPAQRWAALLGDGPDAAATGSALLASWSEPHRRYHDLAHLVAVLDAIDHLDPALPTARRSAGWIARLGAWYHDAVYVVGDPDNEARSARRAHDELGALGVAPTRAAEVARVVGATADHLVEPGDRAGALLCDADLAVLGQEPDRYDRYVAAVRAEYAQVEEAGWRTGRGAVLRALLGRPHLYATDVGRGR